MDHYNQWAEQSNPYEAPESYVEDHYASYDPWAGRPLASRGTRLAAACVDGGAVVVAILPFLVVYFSLIMSGGGMSTLVMLGLAMGTIMSLGLGAYNLWRLFAYQQTLGKQVMKIQIVRSDRQTPAGFGRILGLRMLVMGFLGWIPLVGTLIQLIDPLLIFQGSQQCLHDLIADTNVVLFEE